MSRKRWRLATTAVLVACGLGGLAVAQDRPADLADDGLARPATPPATGESLTDAGQPVLDAGDLTAATRAEPVAEAAVATPDAPPDLGPLQVTIYGDGHALVRSRETYQLATGPGRVQFGPVARQADPTTVRLRPVSGGAGLRVLDQSGPDGTGTGRSLVTAAIGQPVRVRDGRYTVDGTLLAVEDEGVVVASDQEVHIHPTGQLILPYAGAAPDLTPRVAWTVEAQDAGPLECEVSYLTSGLTWAADYAVTVADQQRMISLEGCVRVENQAGLALQDAGLIFTGAPGGPTDEAAAAAPQRYYLPRRVSLPDGEARRFALVQAPAARSAVRYVVGLTGGPAAPVRLAAELVNDAAAGLGLPLPPGPVRLYAPDRANRLELVGQTRLAATPAGAPLRFDLGPTDDVTASVVDTPVAGGVRRQVRLRNLRTDEVRVRVEERRGGGFSLVSASVGFTPPAAGVATAEVTVPANGTMTVTYQLRLGAAAPAGSPT